MKILELINKSRFKNWNFEDKCILAETIEELIGETPTNKELQKEIKRQENIHL